MRAQTFASGAVVGLILALAVITGTGSLGSPGVSILARHAGETTFSGPTASPPGITFNGNPYSATAASQNPVMSYSLLFLPLALGLVLGVVVYQVQRRKLS